MATKKEARSKDIPERTNSEQKFLTYRAHRGGSDVVLPPLKLMQVPPMKKLMFTKEFGESPRKSSLEDRLKDVERDGGPSYPSPKYNSPAANAERDGGPEYDTSNMKGEEMKHGGLAKKYAKGGSVSSRADGIAQRGKTRGKMC